VTDSSKPAGSQVTTYTWDLRNRLTGINAPGTADDATYTYDSNGVRISETTGGNTTYFLNDPNNPTGYTKAIEEKTSPAAAPTRSYVLGNKVEAQSDAASGTVYFLTDGHGSTRALTNSPGAVVSGTDYDFDAYGQPLNFVAEDAKTNWLFAGDGAYDSASGWTYHLARWRDAFRFTSFDSFEEDSTSPAKLHKYSYAGANPLVSHDASGHSLIELANTAFEYSRQISQRFPAVRVVMRTGRAVISAATIIGLATDPRAREEFVMFSVASMDDPGEALAAEFAALRGFARTVQSSAKTLVYLRYMAGDLADFWKKSRQLQIAAEGGGLVRVTGKAYESLREVGAAAQAAYRKNVLRQYAQFLENFGHGADEARQIAAERLRSLQADHRIELQLSKMLSDPNSSKNLQMLDGAVNGSIGSQLKSEMNRLGLKDGDSIDQIIILAPEATGS
jgi:RHS repeat-associated protein